MLNIANSKSKFKLIKKCDMELVEAVRQATCCGFRLNSDQEFVLNEVTTWFKAKSVAGSERQEEQKEDSQEDFDILGIEDALSQQQQS
jgi:hypothetical protein